MTGTRAQSIVASSNVPTFQIGRADKQTWTTWLLLAIAAVVAMSFLIWVTDHGPGINPDSVVYIESARNLLQGNGFQYDGKPMTHFGPVYPVLVAVEGLLFDGDLVQAARWLDVFLYGINILLIGAAAYISSGRCRLAVLLCLLVIISSGDLLMVDSTAASEPPFIALSLASFVLLSTTLAKQRSSTLVAAALFLGLAMATRYVGVTLLPPMVMCLLLMDGDSMAHRMSKCFVLSGVALLPLAAWLVRNVMVFGGATDRTLLFHPVSWDQVKGGILTICNFYFPNGFTNLPLNMRFVNEWLKLALLIVIGVFVIIEFYRKEVGAQTKMFLSLMIVFCGVYASFILVSISFFDASIPLDSRILSPIFIYSTIVSVSLCSASKRWLRGLSVAFLLAVVVANAPHATAVGLNLHQNGQGYTERQWKESETVDFVKSLGTAVTVYSNGPDAIHFLTGRRTQWVPGKVVSSTSLIPTKDFAQRTGVMCGDIAQNGAIVAYLNRLLWRPHLLTQEELQQACDVSATHWFVDGVVYERK